MRITVHDSCLHLNNNDIRWYLSDEKLWVTPYNSYAEIERSIKQSVGSFNWLYEINDTVLFNNRTGNFETVIIDLSGKIKTADLQDVDLSYKQDQLKTISLESSGHMDFTFNGSVLYEKKKDFLLSCPKNIFEQEFSVISIVPDYGFIVSDGTLVGWVLRHASTHVFSSQNADGYRMESNADLLSEYIMMLNAHEKGDVSTADLMNLLNRIRENEDHVSAAVKECLINILWMH